MPINEIDNYQACINRIQECYGSIAAAATATEEYALTPQTFADIRSKVEQTLAYLVSRDVWLRMANDEVFRHVLDQITSCTRRSVGNVGVLFGTQVNSDVCADIANRLPESIVVAIYPQGAYAVKIAQPTQGASA